MKQLLLALLFCNCFETFAYVISKTDYGNNVHWNVRNNEIELFINTSRTGMNSSDITDVGVENIIKESIDQWNKHSKFKIIPRFTSNKLSKGTGQTLTFTSNAAFFGSGTLAVTSVGYKPSNGEILTADILVNESLFNNVQFTDNPALSSGSFAYLGDVLTHELGHFLGLSHSEAPGSSMGYTVFKGMHSLEKDDIYGVKKLYGPNSGAVIRGKVVGGPSIGVFGVNVNLISSNTGKLVANVLTNTEGEFKFSALPADNYLIHTSPIKSKANLPQYYKSAIANYCRGDFVPSYFTKCGGRDRGKPQVLRLKSGQDLNVKQVTIRCDSAHDPNYLNLKAEGYPEPYHLRSLGSSSFGQTFYGIFLKEDVENSVDVSDKFLVNLSDMTTVDSNHYLDLKFQVEALSSAMDLEVSVKRSDELSATVYTTDLDPVTNKKLLNLVVRHPLSNAIGNNVFEITVTPKGLDVDEKTQIFGTIGDLISKQYYYSIIQGVSVGTPDGPQLVAVKNSGTLEDNHTCTEGNVLRTTRAHLNSTGKNGDIDGGVDTKIISCGTVDFDSSDGPPGGGLFSFALGLLAIVIPFQRRIRRAILLS